jgi:hypothetical protein
MDLAAVAVVALVCGISCAYGSQHLLVSLDVGVVGVYFFYASSDSSDV